jgi:sarcosine oxidase subunit beta
MRETADVVIVGGGVMGCSILYNLARQGVVRSLLLEQNVLGSGSTGRSQAICRMHYSNPVTAAMAWGSLQIFANFSSIVGGTSGFVKTGYLVIVGPIDRGALEQNVAMQQELGIRTSLITPEEVKILAPMLDVSDAGAMAWEPDSGYADPYLVTRSYAARARELGAQVETHTAVTGIEVSSGQVRAVMTGRGRVDTSVVVVAAGPWSRQILAKLGLDLPLTPMRHQVALLTRPLDQLPHHPTVADLAQSLSFRPEGANFTMVGFGEEEANVEGYNQGVDMPEVAEALRRVARRMPAMSESYFRGGWSGLFDVTPDWHPVLDRVPGIEGLYLAAGFSGHGFKLSPMVGIAMSELIVRGQASSVDITPLRFSRFTEGELLSSRYRYRVLA